MASRLAALLLAWWVGSAPAAWALELTVSPARAVLEVPAGGTVTFPIRVLNAGEAPMPVRAYAWDQWYGDDQRTTFGPPGTMPQGAASWVSVLPARTVVEPGASAELLATVSAPDDADAGRYAVVFVQTDYPKPEGGTHAVAAGRIGVQVLLRIKGTGSYRMDMDDVAFRPPTDTRPGSIVLSLSNEGTLHVRPEFKGLIRTVDGDVVGRIDKPPHKFYLPGQRFKLEMAWAGTLEPGPYEIVGTLLYGDGLTTPVVYPFLVRDTGVAAPDGG